MGPKERKKRERDERRELILNAANEIMTAEGLDNVSIRKIANKIEYSPGIIYHYFKDKDDIVNHLIKQGYQKIVNGLSAAQEKVENPQQKLEQFIRNYIDVALQMPDEYKTVQLSSDPGILEHTASLFKGASARKPALNILFQCLKDIYRDQDIDEPTIELTAQIIASATFGLIIRLIIEGDLISPEQRSKLITHYIKTTVKGLIKGADSVV